MAGEEVLAAGLVLSDTRSSWTGPWMLLIPANPVVSPPSLPAPAAPAGSVASGVQWRTRAGSLLWLLPPSCRHSPGSQRFPGHASFGVPCGRAARVSAGTCGVPVVGGVGRCFATPALAGRELMSLRPPLETRLGLPSSAVCTRNHTPAGCPGPGTPQCW